MTTSISGSFDLQGADGFSEHDVERLLHLRDDCPEVAIKLHPGSVIRVVTDEDGFVKYLTVAWEVEGGGAVVHHYEDEYCLYEPEAHSDVTQYLPIGEIEGEGR